MTIASAQRALSCLLQTATFAPRGVGIVLGALELVVLVVVAVLAVRALRKGPP